MRFVLANCGDPLKWVPSQDSYRSRKDEVKPHMVEPSVAEAGSSSKTGPVITALWRPSGVIVTKTLLSSWKPSTEFITPFCLSFVQLNSESSQTLQGEGEFFNEDAPLVAGFDCSAGSSPCTPEVYGHELEPTRDHRPVPMHVRWS